MKKGQAKTSAKSGINKQDCDLQIDITLIKEMINYNSEQNKPIFLEQEPTVKALILCYNMVTILPSTPASDECSRNWERTIPAFVWKPTESVSRWPLKREFRLNDI